MIAKLKELLGIARPGGIDDIVVRAIKTGVAVFIAQPFVSAVLRGEFDLNLLRAAALAAGAAIVSVLINAALVALAKFSASD